MGYSQEDFRFFKVSTKELNNLIVATHALEHLRERYFPWGAANQLEPNRITKGEIRYREWAARNRSSDLYTYGKWSTKEPYGRKAKVEDDEGKEVDLVYGSAVQDRDRLYECARIREMVLLAKGGACEECALTTFDYVRTRPFDHEYRYVHRATWGGAHEYVLLGGLSKDKSSMKNYIMVDPWTTSPQVCLFEHSYWYEEYTAANHHRYVIDVKNKRFQRIRQVDEYAKKSNNKEQLLIKALKQAKRYFYKQIPLPWMCLKCGEHLSNDQIVADKAICHGCNEKVRVPSSAAREALINVLKKNKKLLIDPFKKDDKVSREIRKQFKIDFKRLNPKRKPPKVMPLIEDPENPYEFTRTKVGTGKFFKGIETTKIVRKIGKPKVKVIRPGPPKDKKTTKIWGEEIWNHKYCTKDLGLSRRLAYYDDVRFNKETATKFWGEHIEKCKLKEQYNPLVDKYDPLIDK